MIGTISQAIFPVAAIAIALGFAAHVGHAVMLANGRRSMPVLIPNRQPAWAGVVGGSFASERIAAASSGPDLAGSPTPLGRAAIVLTSIGFAVLLVSLALRAYAVGRGPWSLPPPGVRPAGPSCACAGARRRRRPRWPRAARPRRSR